jgi:hypothetical protein
MASASIDPRLGFPAKGTLRGTSLATIIRETARRHASGTLYLLHDTTKKVVFFDRGTPVFVRSNVLSECLGQVLTEEGLITKEQCDQTLEAMRRTGKKQGELLVEMGILSEGNLRFGLQAQLRTKLFDIFGWDDGRYQFKPGAPEGQFAVTLEVAPQGLIIEGVQEAIGEGDARERLAERMHRFPFADPDEDLGPLALLPEEEHFIRSLDGSRTLAAVLAASDAEPLPLVPSPAALILGALEAGVAELEIEERVAAPPLPPLRLGPGDLADTALAPTFVATIERTEYEDTPLPGALPTAPTLLGEHDAGFDEVDDHESGPFPAAAEASGAMRADAVAAIVAEERASSERSDVVAAADLLEAIDETFDDEVDFVDAEELDELEELDEPADLDGAGDLAGDDEGGAAAGDDRGPAAASVRGPAIDAAAALDLAVDDDLIADDELDALELPGAPARAWTAPASDDGMAGAMDYAEGEAALAHGDVQRAVALFESAYAHGFDVAELHANLAYARFLASDGGAAATQHSFELLAYAESMDDSLDIVHAYRAAIQHHHGDHVGARASLDRALRLNPYCELAHQLMDAMG